MTADSEIREAARLHEWLREVDAVQAPGAYNGVARNERADTRIIDGPALELIPPGRGRSTTRGMRP